MNLSEDFCQWCYDRGLRYSRPGPWGHANGCPNNPNPTTQSSAINRTNIAYICIFLRNAGETFRAIVLARDVFQCSLVEARAWVESVKWERVKIDNSKARELHQQYPCHMWPEELADGFEVKVSHFPNRPNPHSVPTPGEGA